MTIYFTQYKISNAVKPVCTMSKEKGNMKSYFLSDHKFLFSKLYNLKPETWWRIIEKVIKSCNQKHVPVNNGSKCLNDTRKFK